MNGKNQFYKKEANGIKSLLLKIRESDREVQKQLRNELRDNYRFFISDYTKSKKGFTLADFDTLINSGQVIIITE